MLSGTTRRIEELIIVLDRAAAAHAADAAADAAAAAASRGDRPTDWRSSSLTWTSMPRVAAAWTGAGDWSVVC